MIAALAGVNLAVVFGAELSGLAGFGVWGAQAVAAPAGRWVLAVAVPLAAAVLWGLFCAPKAVITLPGPAVTGIKLALLAAAVLALLVAGHPWWATTLAIVALLSALLAGVLPDPWARPGVGSG